MKLVNNVGGAIYPIENFVKYRVEERRTYITLKFALSFKHVSLIPNLGLIKFLFLVFKPLALSVVGNFESGGVETPSDDLTSNFLKKSFR